MSDKTSHHFLPTSSDASTGYLLSRLGISSIEELFRDIPERLTISSTLNVPKAMAESEIRNHILDKLNKNKSTEEMPTFLGAGVWPHYVPAVVKSIVSRSEFYTSYTPYQPEISQGLLQALFEYQSMICDLTGMEVANSSMYDWASALGEASRMAARISRRGEIIVPRLIHAGRLETLKAYCEPVGVKIRTCDYDRHTGMLSTHHLGQLITDHTAAVYVEVPSFVGALENDPAAIADLAHSRKALFIVGFDPISLGGLRRPGDYSADIAVGEGQPLSSEMNFGGPLLGVMACKTIELARQMPGRLVGETTNDQRSRAFALVLQTREQHIRREKATSNICTNQALLALASAVNMALLGPTGLRKLFETIMVKTYYAMRRLSKIDGIVAPAFNSAHFREFTIQLDASYCSVSYLNEQLLENGIHGGLPLQSFFPELSDRALYCVTETHTQNQIDRLVQSIEHILETNKS